LYLGLGEAQVASFSFSDPLDFGLFSSVSINNCTGEDSLAGDSVGRGLVKNSIALSKFISERLGVDISKKIYSENSPLF
jgi:hypothetical protein